eukprot:763205-Hanusia_phi.AAC.2
MEHLAEGSDREEEQQEEKGDGEEEIFGPIPLHRRPADPQGSKNADHASNPVHQLHSIGCQVVRKNRHER